MRYTEYAKHGRLGEEAKEVAAFAVSGIMKGKRKHDVEKRKNDLVKKKRRIIKPPSTIGGFLPMLLAILGALGALGGGVSPKL